MIAKKGVFFSTDALIAVTLILFVVILAYPLSNEQKFNTDIHYDLLETLQTLTLEELDNAQVQQLIASGEINNTNKTILEYIGELYTTNITAAQNLANAVLTELNVSENVGLWYDTTLISSLNTSSIEDAKEIKTTRQIISGIKAGENVVGLSARALLRNTAQIQYTYLGGYVGDGNLTLTSEYNGTITHAELELTINKNFEIYVNENYTGNYSMSPSDVTPTRYTIPITHFHSGVNRIELRSSGAYAAGGFLRVTYNSDLIYQNPQKYYFPGIQGLVNVYDGLYLPGQLQNMSAYLHFNTSQRTFLTIGNKTIMNTSGLGETIITLTDDDLRALLNYNELSNTSTPIRFGLENVSLVQNGTSNADVILITDISGSMDWRLDSDSTGIARNNCSDPLLYDSSTKRISLAKCLDKQFVATILSAGNNRVGLVAFESDANSYVDLTSNQVTLNNTIDAYSTGGATCVSCAINRAYSMLQTHGNATRPKYIIVMTDGVANVRSTETCTDIYGVGVSTSYKEASGINGILLRRSTTLWDEITSPTTNTLNDIELYSDTLGFAVGSSGTIIKWDGSSWSSVTSPIATTINAIDLNSTTFGFAVGASGRVLKWNGTVWSTAATISNSPTLYGVSIVNQSLIYAAGLRTGSGRIYRSTNGGTTWSEVLNSGSTIRDIRMANATFGFTVGNNGEINRWNGASWSSVTSGTSDNLYRVERINSTAWTAVGGDNGNSVVLSYTSSWSELFDSGGDSLRDIGFTGSDQYALGEGATVFEKNTTAWTKKFNIPLAYMGNETTGITCTTDQDSCSESNSYPSLNANYSSCRAHNELNATVHAIGFGPITTCSFATQTLQAIASCGNGSFYSSSNATILQQFYSSIAQDIIQLSYTEQTSQLQGNLSTRLYPDSYIQYQITQPTLPYGVILTQEQNVNATGGLQYTIPSGVTLLESRMTSYSGAKWTKELQVNGSVIYNLTKWGTDYSSLGDPFVIAIPKASLINGSHLKTNIGVAPSNETFGSSTNKLIVTTARNASSFSPITSTSEGCIWTIDFEDNTNDTMALPSGYAGATLCYYQESTQAYNPNDAAQSAVWLLLRSLDANNNNRVDVHFSTEDVAINLTTIQGIPFSWSTEVQVRTWR